MTDMRPVEPIYTGPLFPDLHAELMTLLRVLAPADWSRTTWAAPWTVKDVVAHLLDGQIRNLSICRNGLSPFPAEAPRPRYDDRLRMLDGLNAEWVAVARRIGAKLLIDLLAVTGPQDAGYHGSLDPMPRPSSTSPGPVSRRHPTGSTSAGNTRSAGTISSRSARPSARPGWSPAAGFTPSSTCRCALSPTPIAILGPPRARRS